VAGFLWATVIVEKPTLAKPGTDKHWSLFQTGAIAY